MRSYLSTHPPTDLPSIPSTKCRVASVPTSLYLCTTLVFEQPPSKLVTCYGLLVCVPLSRDF